jgi:3-oxoacyl-[acyl-carrier protein] reductase
MKLLITGTSKGIGEALASHYLSLGHDVIGCGRSEIGMGDYRKCDISDEQSVNDFYGWYRTTYGSLDVLINNAGVGGMNHFLAMTPWSIEQILNINLRGTILMMQNFSRLLRSSPHGRIVNFTTVAVPWRLAGESVYAASKAAVESLTRTLAHELAPYNITVNAVGPTPTPTNLIGRVPQDKIDALIERQAIKRMATMEDIANVVDFFIQPASDFITGQVVYLGGVS